MKWDSMKGDRMKWDRMKWDMMKWDRMKWDRMKWYRMKWDRMKWDRTKKESSMNSYNKKTTRCTSSQIYLIKYSTCFGQVHCPSSGVSQHCTHTIVIFRGSSVDIC